MPPRKKQRAATAEATQQPDRDTLIRCFLWEIAQALKGSYLTSTYNVRQKITFARDYSLLVPIDVLRNAALAKFAHPLQRLLAQLSMILFRLPDVAEQLIIHEVFFSRWHPESMLNGKPRGDCLFNSLREVKAACEEFFISDPVQAGNKLTMRLPKDSEKLPSGGRSGSLLAQQARLVQRVLSSLPPAMHRRWWRDHAAGLAPLIQAAEAAITHASMANVLNLPPPVDATAPHSLELMVKLQSREGTSRALAVITVASDLAVTDLVNLCTHEFEDLGDLSSWTYLIVKDPHAKAKFIAARGNDEMVARLMRAREVGHMTQEQMREVGHMTHEQMQLLLPPVSDANEAPIIHDVVVRIWAIESAKFPGCYSGYGSRGEVERDDEELPAKRVEQTADGRAVYSTN
ncbi:hypothetical protein T484DRAFT_1759531 [Baffinella frigidus]|nr:hypothetical protein T484DRAFT_1759531 [Cryptophyta sp. CCMP2293]